MFDWIADHQTLVWWLFIGTLAVLLISPLAAAVLVARLPSDYFARLERRRSKWGQQNPALRAVVVVAKNVLGVILVSAGLIMLMTPGQGLLTVLMGVLLIDFPGRRRVERWIVTRRAVWRSMNWLRRRAGREEFQRPR